MKGLLPLENSKRLTPTIFVFTRNLPVPNFTKPPLADGPKHWNSGPPYLATVKDMYQIVVRWTELAPRVLRMHDHLFAGTRVVSVSHTVFVAFITHPRLVVSELPLLIEMYGFIFATHQLNLPFTLVKSFVLSETASRIREGWEYIDQIKDEEVCQSVSLIKLPLPVTLHYCERYAVQNFCTRFEVRGDQCSPLVSPFGLASCDC
jgi:peptidyl serine alpha-galactosyltransferase